MATMQDKIALITGGNKGIGRAAALKFAAEGAKVVIGNRNETEALAVVDQIKSGGGDATFLKTDVTDKAQLQALHDFTVETFGRIDAAFNNAGIEGDLAELIEQTDDNFDNVFNTNVRAVYWGMQMQVRQMLAQHPAGGAIVNNSSVTGHVGFPGLAIYTATKHAVNGLTRAAALEVGFRGIRINAVSPACIKTDMLYRFFDEDLAPPVKDVIRKHPIGRFGEPEEIANLAVWLCSSEASFITGQPLLADGAFTSI